MILDRTKRDEEGEGHDEAYSARMLFVANDVTQTIKEDVPTLNKQISRDGDYFGTEAAGVGDEVNFRLTGTLPSNYDQYTLGYEFIFTDTLSKGLTLKGTEGETLSGSGFDYDDALFADTDFVVKVKGVYNSTDNKFEPDLELTIKTTDYVEGTHAHDTTGYAYNATVTEDENGQQVLTVTFPCLKEIEIEGNGTNGGAADTIYTLGVNASDKSQKSQIYINLHCCCE